MYACGTVCQNSLNLSEYPLWVGEGQFCQNDSLTAVVWLGMLSPHSQLGAQSWEKLRNRRNQEKLRNRWN